MSLVFRGFFHSLCVSSFQEFRNIDIPCMKHPQMELSTDHHYQTCIISLYTQFKQKISYIKNQFVIQSIILSIFDAESQLNVKLFIICCDGKPPLNNGNNIIIIDKLSSTEYFYNTKRMQTLWLNFQTSYNVALECVFDSCVYTSTLLLCIYHT